MQFRSFFRLAMGIAVGGALFFFALPSQARWTTHELNNERAIEVSNSRYWHLLLHYKPTLFGGYRSLADGPEFFLSENGKSNPLQELFANIEAFSDTETRRIGPLKQHPQCAFPERYRYLKEALRLRHKDVKCPEFEAWRPRFAPTGATLVFASAYLNNPASMFGHTFLRIDSKPRAGHDKKNDLLDYGINYSAKTGEDSGITFAVLGLVGGYPGFFSLLPYFEKVQEYSDVESRDLWEYPLRLSTQQIERMIAHIWELGTTYFDYFFFDENCSYHLLSLLEIGNPDWHLTDAFFYHVIPGNTVRVLTKIRGALGPAKFRPSLHRRLYHRFLQMTPSEKEAFQKARKGNYHLSGAENAVVLDALIDQQTYDLMRTKQNEAEEDKLRRHRLLLARAKVPSAGETENTFVPESETRPDLGVPTAKLTGGIGRLREQTYFGIQLRPVYHDLYDQDAGYLPFSELTIARTHLRYYPQQRRFRLHSFHIAEVTSLAPSDALGSRTSWTVAGGVVSPNDLNCNNCNAFALEGGAGESIGLAKREGTGILYGLLKATVQYSGWFEENFRFGPLAEVGAIVSFANQFKLGGAARFAYFPTQQTSNWSFEPTWKLSWLFLPSLELRLEQTWIATKKVHGFDSSGALSWYF